MKKVDYIIVGAGLAGCLLAKELIDQGCSVTIYHSKSENNASKVAIGLVNPITGKRLVKSWLIDELLPHARTKYDQLSNEFNKQLLHDCTVARVIPNEDIFNQWSENFLSAVKEGYINETIKKINIADKEWDYFEIKQCFWVEVSVLVDLLVNQFEKRNILQDVQFDYDQFDPKKSSYRGEIQTKGLIFCEGWRANKNPFFNHLPFNLNKGEVAEVAIEDFSFQDILKKNIFLLPQKDNQFRIGSTYDRGSNLNDQTTNQAKDYFLKKLNEIGLSGKINKQKASIRPATKDRRPFIGAHHVHDNIHIFNGFGAKGVSLIPYFSTAFVNELLGGSKVINEASTSRFILD